MSSMMDAREGGSVSQQAGQSVRKRSGTPVQPSEAPISVSRSQDSPALIPRGERAVASTLNRRSRPARRPRLPYEPVPIFSEVVSVHVESSVPSTASGMTPRKSAVSSEYGEYQGAPSCSGEE